MIVVSGSAAATRSLGARLGAACHGGEVLLLEGNLGAGKTCLAKGVAEGLGIDPATVTSPTFTLMRLHHGRLPFYHVDLYRIGSPDEIARLGLFDEVDGPGVTLVEWPTLGGPHPPADALRIHIGPGAAEGERRITLTPSGNAPTHLLNALEREN
ncbi:MAG: tRNA (adenosine(37)-N6)-threonylcarbamoyltransferase complex ATPase subunit type 1 TsaE [Nitrospirae bacterium]|nr:tRNA (adenosine(37)-N6)-threonylcarbamoyltransferase complex ATPase subunit type 1 TsaE [Nitrospirota bacterium]